MKDQICFTGQIVERRHLQRSWTHLNVEACEVRPLECFLRFLRAADSQSRQFEVKATRVIPSLISTVVKQNTEISECLTSRQVFVKLKNWDEKLYNHKFSKAVSTRHSINHSFTRHKASTARMCSRKNQESSLIPFLKENVQLRKMKWVDRSLSYFKRNLIQSGRVLANFLSFEANSPELKQYELFTGESIYDDLASVPERMVVNSYSFCRAWQNDIWHI